MPLQQKSNISNNTHISTVNSHIEDFLDYYCDLKTAPQFAILLKGDWGCGKSWFINKYIEKIKKTGIKPLYVSLYGVNSFSQIEESLFEQIHPVLGSKGMKIAGLLFKGLLKGTLKVDLTQDGKDDGVWNFSVSDLKIDEKFKINDSHFGFLIFDDLERCSLDIENILGYIHSFLEGGNLKIIIISNDNEIKDTEKYLRIKEKLIGKTFEIHSDIENTFNTFVEQIENESIRQILSNNIQTIKQVYEQGDCKNLRILNQITLDFKRIYDKLPDKGKQHKVFINDLLKILTIFSIEIASGKLNPQEISKIKDIMLKKYLAEIKQDSTQNNKETNEIPENLDWLSIFDKYQIFDYDILTVNNYPFPDFPWWQDFFYKGLVEEQYLNKNIDNSQYFIDENTPDYIKILNINKLSNQEFEELLNKIIKKYQKKEFDDINIIKHLISLFIWLHQNDIYSYKKDEKEIVADGKNYINYLIQNNKFDYYQYYNQYKNDISKQAFGIGFFSVDDDDFNDFNSYILDTCKQEVNKKTNILAQDLLKILENDYLKFLSKVSPTGNVKYADEMNYYEYPIFYYIKAKDFWDKFLLILQSNKYDNWVVIIILKTIKKRYEILLFPELSDELYFWEDLANLMEQKIKENDFQKKLSSFYLKKSINLIKDIIDKIKKT